MLSGSTNTDRLNSTKDPNAQRQHPMRQSATLNLSSPQLLQSKFYKILMNPTKYLLSGLSFFLFSGCFNVHKKAERPSGLIIPASILENPGFYDFRVNTLEGEPFPFAQLKGKKVVILNVASKCGFTPQYADWQQFHENHGEEVTVLGFPCNEFGNQEPGTAEDIREFCSKNYGVTFPILEKVHVKKGEKQAPVYQWLTDPELNGWNAQVPSWNFCKYIISENGELTHFFASAVKPENTEFREAIGL
jgi:glutathione peroxidase